MKKTYLFLLFSLFFVLALSCGDDDNIDTNREKNTLTFEVSYKGSKEIKQIRAALFDYEVAVKNDLPSGPPFSTMTYPQEPLTQGGIDFSDNIKIKLEGIKSKKYLVVIFGDVDTSDGKFSVNKIDPVYTLKNYTVKKDETIDALLKDQDESEDLCSKDNPNGKCEDGKTCQDGVCVGEVTCEPECDGKICGDDGCGGICGECDEGFSCSEAQDECLEVSKTYDIKIKLTYSGNKNVKRIGIAGYYEASYQGMPDYVQFVDDTSIEFPYTFTFNPTKDGALGNIDENYSGDFYIWLYGDVDGSGFQATDEDPQVKFKLTLPVNDEVKSIEIKDL